jgi:cellulose synthase/poly-beta-1,6-N-acetylglucosamine synthase-like glycosyltransferase
MLLRGLLESLTSQTLSPSEYEVVVVDDGSTDETQAVVSAFQYRLPLQSIRQGHAGLASAKNHGLFRTRAPIVLFLDDDDIADSRLLEEHVRAHRRYSGLTDAVLGFTGLGRGLEDDPLMHFVTKVGCFQFSYGDLVEEAALDYTYFWGGRSSCKRSFLLTHGVFNPVFRFGCEDIELGFRLSRHGLRVMYHPRALSWMVRGMTVDEFCGRLARQGRSNAVFSRLHADESVQRWTEVAGATEVWSVIAPAYGPVTRSARLLDAMYRQKIVADLEIHEDDVRYLHRAYWMAFRASKVKGIVEGLGPRANESHGRD